MLIDKFIYSSLQYAAMKIKDMKKLLAAMLALDNHPRHIATGFAIGVFIGITPFIGLHTLMAVMAAFTFRLNKLTTITGAWANTPFTTPPVLIASYKLGAWLLGETARPFNITTLEWHYLKDFAGALLLGSAVIGLAAAILGYGLCYWLVVRYKGKKARFGQAYLRKYTYR